ncbi:MAG: peptidase MA family metallohydrolase [Candidatus Sericytochromatia bacterium]
MKKLLRVLFPILFFVFFNTNAYSEEYLSKNKINVAFEKKNEKLAQYILETSQDVKNSIKDKIGIDYNKQLNIKISPSKKVFDKETGIQNLDVQGVAISDIGLVIINSENIVKNSNDDIFKLLEHEFAHIYLGDYISHSSDISFPRWLNEGIAQYVSGGTSELFSFSYQNSLQSAFMSNKVLPFSSLIDNFPNTRDSFTLAYAQSISMVQFLVDKYGVDKIKDLIMNIKEENNFYRAFNKTYSIDFSDIEKEWLSEKRTTNFTIDYYLSTHISDITNALIVIAALLAFIANFIRTRRKKKAYELVEESN